MRNNTDDTAVEASHSASIRPGSENKMNETDMLACWFKYTHPES